MGLAHNGSITKAPASDAESTPPVQTPETKPASPSPPTNGGNLGPSPSPLLDPLPATSIAAPTAPSTTATNIGKDWSASRNGSAALLAAGLSSSPGLAGSPSNLISLMGESPPTQPSSYEDQRSIHGWGAPAPVAGAPPRRLSPFVNSPPISASPPAVSSPLRRPLSFQMDYGHAQHPDHAMHNNPGAATATAAANANRRSSVHSHLSHARVPSHPPLPHQPQAHFYGAPDIDFDIEPRAGMKAGQRGYFYGFDTLAMMGPDGGSLGSDTVVLAGYEGGLDVFSVRKRGLDLIASLKGLRGGVYQAKVLPWTASVGGDRVDMFPLVAVVVHGPVIPTATPSTTTVEPEYEAASNQPVEAPGTPPVEHPPRERSGSKSAPVIESFQTCVEVYSLRTGKLVDVLLQAPQIPIKTPVTSPIFKPPPPSGSFTIKADAGTVIVASGQTGECWLFRQFPQAQDGTMPFLCIGKLWTTVQQSAKSDTPEPGRVGEYVPQRPNLQTPLVAINGRWIAYCPPAPSSQIALRVVVPIPYGKVPGYSTKTPPQLPPVSSELDLPISESMVNKIMRETTQELIQGAKWVGQQGLQAWNNYWNRPAPTSQQAARSPPLGSQAWTGGAYQNRPDSSQFPPTHGTPGQAVTKDPRLVSIVDVETLGHSSSIHPLTTFSTPLGCSFLAFSPTGLALFTASSKGDVQTVWDLMRIQYTRSSPLQPTVPVKGQVQGPRVRQMAQFSRMTVARIVDVTWTRPNGERAAMVTERGTVHILEMDPQIFTWPPPRRRAPAAVTAATAASSSGGAAGGGRSVLDFSRTPVSETSSSSAASAASGAVAMASSALSTAFEVARPLITRPRRSSTQNVSYTSNAAGSGSAGGSMAMGIVDQASHGGKAIAASISHSLGKTAGSALHTLRHTGENRVSLPPGGLSPTPGCVAWVVASGRSNIVGTRTPALFMLGEGLVRAFPAKGGRGGGRSIGDGSAAAAGGGSDRYGRGSGGGIGGVPKGSRYRDFKLPLLPDDNIALAVRRYLDPDEYLDLTEREVETVPPPGGGSNATVLLHGGSRPVPRLLHAADHHHLYRSHHELAASSIPHAEIESSAPYQPFHTDRRVALFEYGPGQSGFGGVFGGAPGGDSGSVVLTQRPWAFGQPIATVRLDVGPDHGGHDDDYEQQPVDQPGMAAAGPGGRALPAAAMERVTMRLGGGNAALHSGAGVDGGEQIVVTTRRRRGASRNNSTVDDDGFFEDDCEVLDFADQRV